MNIAFIVQINLDDLSGLPDIAAEIEDDLNNSGFDVISVAPWARPSLVQQGSLIPQNVPKPNITTNEKTIT